MVLSRFFGKKSPIESVRKACQEQRWADCLRLGEALDPMTLVPEVQAELHQMLEQAGDSLARLNLAEAEAFARAGDSAKAGEHFGLARQQARSAELQQDIAAANNRLRAQEPMTAPPPHAAAGHCAGGTCDSGASSDGRAAASPHELDDLTHFELTLSSYPPDLAERYLRVSDAFRESFLAAHEGRDQEALDLFDQLPADEHNDLFYFERGSLLARTGSREPARRDLEKALQLNPAQPLALEALILLEMGDQQLDRAEQLALQGVDKGVAHSFCLGRLATLRAHQGRFDEALDFGRQALAQGTVDADTVVLTASLLEKKGQIDEAEQLLTALGGGGCGGGVPSALAEFWLRHHRNLDKALGAFNHSARSEPQNPRWILRIGETYLAKGWKKDGRALVEKALAHPDLDPQLAESARNLLAS